MNIAKTITELRRLTSEARSRQNSVGFVPTMGALHEGHISLVRASKEQCGITVVSIFVNPTQFAPSEDLAKYPRPIDEDIALLESEGVDILFLPSAEEMYPTDAATYVTVEKITEGFEGVIRPTHFRGVATVVASLFNIVMPDAAFFGQKDLQQVAVIKRMTSDLHFPIKIIIGDTIREADGLAMSSRNRYLSEDERAESLLLSKTLFQISSDILGGSSIQDARLKGANLFNSLKKAAVLEYLEVISAETFHTADSFKPDEEIAVIIAAKIGTTRLIDNVLIRAK